MKSLALLLILAWFQAPTPNQAPTPVPATPLPANVTIRVYNGTVSDAGTKLDFLLDSMPSAQAVDAGTAAGPFVVSASMSSTLEVRVANGSSDIVSDTIPADGNDHVLVVTGDPAQKVTVEDLPVAPTPTDSEKGEVNVLNVAGDSIDFYLVGPNTVIDNFHPAIAAMSPNSTGLVSPEPGTYRAVLVSAGTKNSSVRSDPFQIKAGSRFAVLALPGAADQPDKVAVVSL